MKLEFSPDRFSKNNQKSNFVKVRPVRAELFHAEGRTRDEVNSRLSQLCENRLKKVDVREGRRKFSYLWFCRRDFSYCRYGISVITF